MQYILKKGTKTYISYIILDILYKYLLQHNMEFIKLKRLCNYLLPIKD